MRYLLLIGLWLSGSLLWAQPKKALIEEHHTSIYGQLIVASNPEAAWKAIKENYGHVGNHHKGIKYAYALNEQVPFYYGTVRYSQLNKSDYTKESIVAYDEAHKTFTTTIYESSQNALPILQQRVGIQEENGQTFVYHEIVFENVPRQTLAKIKKWNRGYLKAYKEVIEEMMPIDPKSKQFQLRLASMLYE